MSGDGPDCRRDAFYPFRGVKNRDGRDGYDDRYRDGYRTPEYCDSSDLPADPRRLCRHFARACLLGKR